MLVLTRRANEEIVIGDSIRIRVGELRGNRVRLLIDAPPDVEVYRKEARRPRTIEFALEDAELCTADA